MASLDALATKVLSRTTGAHAHLTPVQLADPTSPTSARHPVGGDEGRAEFVTRVRNHRR